MLRVVVLQEHHGLVRGHQPPGRLREPVARCAARVELRDVLPVHLPELVADANEGEFRDVGCASRAVPHTVEVPWPQRLASAADDFQEHVRQRPPFAGERLVHPVDDVVELHLLDVLGGVDAKSLDAEASEHDQVVGESLPHRLQPGVEVRQRKQLAFLHVGRALIVVQGAGRMEIGGRVEARVVVLAVGRAVTAHAGAREVGHVVDHGVHDDAHTGRAAAVYHVPELVTGSRAAALDTVAHGLVALAPVAARHDAVLLWWRDLYGLEPCRTEHRLALGRDVGPLPLEQVDHDVARRHVATRSIGGIERRPRRSSARRRRGDLLPTPAAAEQAEPEEHDGGGTKARGHEALPLPNAPSARPPTGGRADG